MFFYNKKREEFLSDVPQSLREKLENVPGRIGSSYHMLPGQTIVYYGVNEGDNSNSYSIHIFNKGGHTIYDRDGKKMGFFKRLTEGLSGGMGYRLYFNEDGKLTGSLWGPEIMSSNVEGIVSHKSLIDLVNMLTQ